MLLLETQMRSGNAKSSIVKLTCQNYYSPQEVHQKPLLSPPWSLTKHPQGYYILHIKETTVRAKSGQDKLLSTIVFKKAKKIRSCSVADGVFFSY